MSTGVTVDLREFNQALKEYAVAGKKTMAEASNKKFTQIMLNAAEFSPVGSEGAINNLFSQGLENKERNIARLTAYWLGGGYTRAQAAAFVIKMKERRIKSINFLKSYFVAGADALRGRRTKTGHKAMVVKATQNNLNLSVVVFHLYKDLKSRRWTNPAKTAAKAESMLSSVMNRAIAYGIADMRSYIEGKLGNTAKKYSWKARAEAIRGR